MAPHPKETSHAPLPLPTSRISRLFRPFLTKLASLDSLFLNSAPTVPPPMATRSTRTYSKNDAAKSGDYSGSAKGLPVFERGKKFKRATPRSMPKELIAIPPPSGNKQRPTEKAISNSRLPQLPSIEMAEVSKRVYAAVQAFNNILDVVYPVGSTSVADQVGVEALGATCARRVGENIEPWIEAQLQEEFGYVPNSEEELSSGVEGRRIELRDDWWEGVPEHWRRFSVPVHAITIAIGLNIPMHGLYEALLDACIARAAVYEVSLLLPHMIHHAYTLPSSSINSPGPSYLPTISRKVPFPSVPLGSRWQSVVNKAVASVLTWLDHVSGEDLNQDSFEDRWLGDAIDGLIRDGESKGAGGARLLLEVVQTVLDHHLRETVSELFVQRLSAWTQYMIFLSNTLRLRDPSSTVVTSIDASLKDLCDLLNDRLSPSDLQPIATAVLALELHSIWTRSLSYPTEDNPPITPPRVLCDSVEFCFLPHILSSHTSVSTVLTLATSLRLLSLPTIESRFLECALEEYDRLSPFSDSTILSPEELQADAVTLEELSDLATDAERRRIAANVGDGGTPGGSAKGMRWEEMVGAWVEATPAGRKTRVVRRPRQQLSPLTDEESSEEEEEEEENDESDDPMDALDDSSGEENEVVLSKEDRGLKRMGRMSLDGPSSIASDEEDEDEEVVVEVGVEETEEEEDEDFEAQEDEQEDLDAPSSPPDELAAPSSSSSPVPPPRPTFKRARNSSPIPSSHVDSLPSKPVFNLNKIPPRDLRLSTLVLSRPPRRMHTSLPDPPRAGPSTPSLSSKAPPPWLFSRFSPAAASPLRRLGTSSLVPASPSPLLPSRLNTSCVPLRKTSLQNPIIVSSSPSKFGSSPAKKKTRRTEEDDDDEGFEQENEEPGPPSSEGDDMNLFDASSPAVKLKPLRIGTRNAGGMRERLGRRRVVFGLTREEV
ncbi:hypothetical protein BDY24DRAFT_380582 [Mrakia frigida]|uniref:uncharacterized protein n=1 Tax=Mrakia frigida TaxID=29902 RepID=UPI003FCC0E2E